MSQTRYLLIMTTKSLKASLCISLILGLKIDISPTKGFLCFTLISDE